MFCLKVMRIEDLAWVYEKVVQHRINHIIPAGKTYEAVIYDRHGQVIGVSAAEVVVRGLLMELAARAPWAMVGYTWEASNAWRGSREDLIRELDERKRQFASADGNLDRPAPAPPTSPTFDLDRSAPRTPTSPTFDLGRPAPRPPAGPTYDVDGPAARPDGESMKKG